MNNEDRYSTYNVSEIKAIIDEAIQFEMWETRNEQEKWDTLLNLQTRLYDKFGISD